MIARRVEGSSSAGERQRWVRQYEHAQHRLFELGEVEFEEMPDWLAAYIGRFKTKLVSARRLEHRLRPEAPNSGDAGPASVVDRFAMDLAEHMRDQLSLYAAESRRQEKVLPSQIVKAMQATGPEQQPEELARDVDRLRTEVRTLADSLIQVGLFQEEDPDPQLVEYPRDNTLILLAVREVYRVTLQRLERLTNLRTELALFASFLNQRLTNKRIDLDQRSGLVVVLDREERIKPSQLSSGEQQLLAVAFELLFQTEPNALVLLDEPELSLHVAWLNGLISGLLEIGMERDLQFLIATHSPSVLAGHQDRERSLDELLVDEPL
jgi:hypothetical protein